MLHMQKPAKRLTFFGCLVLLALVAGLTACAGQTRSPAAPRVRWTTVEPGTLENKGHPKMPLVELAHKALAPSDDEIVVYYLREDKKYDPWGFWLWAIPGGDGGKVWSQTRDLAEVEGVAYLRFKLDGSTLGIPTVGPDGRFGLIPRKDAGWEKDGDADRLLDATVSRFWVVFEGEQKTYPYGPYVPSIERARLDAGREILLDLSGHYGLDFKPGNSGFYVRSADGQREFTILDSRNLADLDTRENNYARWVRLHLAEDIPLDQPVVVGHPEFLTDLPLDATLYANRLAESLVPPESYRLGAVYDASRRAVEFRLWTPFASRVQVRLYSRSLAERADYSLDLTKDTATGIWSAYFGERDPDGWFYEYSVWFGKSENIVLDPYALSMDAFVSSGPGRGAIINPAKALPPGGWEGYDDVHLARREDAIIYEISVRDFTIAPEAGTKARPGSYLAFIEKIPYLKELGVTHVQLMPVLNFYYTNELETGFEANRRAHDNNYNWGYDPHSYFAPEGWFASDARDPYVRMVELKTLIKEVHKAGMGVLLDVVYNHTANTAILDDIVPGYFYRRDSRGVLTNNSGVGNDLATERSMASRLIRDSLYYWVDEFKVDGFRFDLMGLIDAETILSARERIAKLPGKADILFQGEGWKMYRGPSLEVLDQNYMMYTNDVAVFNDEFRDLLKAGGLNDRAKGFVTGKPGSSRAIFENLAGRPTMNYTADSPGDSMNYVSAHDNLTLADNIAFNTGVTADTAAGRAEIAARARLANFLVLTGQPIAFLHGGCERGRTKPRLDATTEFTGDYVHNSYDASDDINQFPWRPAAEYAVLNDYVRNLIAIRKAEVNLRLGDAAVISQAMRQLPQDDPQALGWLVDHGGTMLLMLVNAAADRSVSFELPLVTLGAKVLVAGEQASPLGLTNPQGLRLAGQTAEVAPLSAVMLKLGSR